MHGMPYTEVRKKLCDPNIFSINEAYRGTWPDKIRDEVWSLQLSMVMDFLNPFSLPNTNFYMCLVVVINKNIPQWLTMENEHLMLALMGRDTSI